MKTSDYDPPERSHGISGRRLGHRSLVLAWAALAWLAVGCASPEQESDWRWKQFNPNYRPPLPPADMGH